MKNQQQNLYEGMFIVSASLSEDARNKALERIQSEITERGGKVHNVIEFGRRRLAYEISGHKEGYYYILYFEVLPSAITEMWKEFHLLSLGWSLRRTWLFCAADRC